MQLADQHEGTTTKALAGLRVPDFSTTIAGPHCARMPDRPQDAAIP
jgi:hypothetical protein